MKNKQTMVTMCLLGILVLVGLASSQQGSDLPLGVEAVNDCINVTWEESFPNIESCSRPIKNIVCSDEPKNESCSEQDGLQEYPCIVGTRVEKKSRLECTTKAYTINDQVKINIDGYACKTQQEGTMYTVVCDSKRDGNSDGICQSGESCQKFVINGNDVQKYEKNSQEEFTTSDDSFFLAKATAEVLQ